MLSYAVGGRDGAELKHAMPSGENAMRLRATLHGRVYDYPDLRVLMGKANEEKSGDQLAGIAADAAAERIAARYVLEEVPLDAVREHPAVPYDEDELTRVIHDALDAAVYSSIR